jgi:hypothetical protein
MVKFPVSPFFVHKLPAPRLFLHYEGCYLKVVLRALSTTTVALCAVATTCWACSCIERTCGPRRYLDVDFVGEIVSRRFLPPDGKVSTFFSNLFQARVYRVRVIESFRGGHNKGDFVTVKTGLGGGDCGYGFAIGAKYLIDAAKQDNILLTSICSLTSPLAQSEGELRILRMIAAGQHLPDVSGVLVREADPPDSERSAPIPGVVVEMRRAAGGVPFKAVTDSIGAFTFSNLPEDSYQMTLGLPVGLGVSYTNVGTVNGDQIPPLTVEHRDGGPAACYFRVFIGPSGTIAGVVKSTDGGQVDGWVRADTVTRNGQSWNTVASAVPTPDGVFLIAHLKPGRYQIRFTSHAGFVEGTPQTIDLREGERRTGLVVQAH